MSHFSLWHRAMNQTTGLSDAAFARLCGHRLRNELFEIHYWNAGKPACGRFPADREIATVVTRGPVHPVDSKFAEI